MRRSERRSRRSGDRRSTPAGVPRSRASRSAWSSSSSPWSSTRRSDPVDLLPFDAAEVLGPVDYVPTFNRLSHTVSPSPSYRRVSSGARYSSRLGALARLARGESIRIPSRVDFCVARKQRKQVLFAKGVAGGYGVGRGKRWRRTSNSFYRC